MGSVASTCCSTDSRSKRANRNKHQESLTKISFINKTQSKHSTIVNIKSPAPTVVKLPSNSLHEEETTISTERINSLKAMSKYDANCIREQVLLQYAPSKSISSEESDEESQESDLSELSSDGQLEIDLRRKSEPIPNKKKAHLYRHKTVTRWSVADLDDMEEEMKKQYDMLMKQSESFSGKDIKISNNTSNNMTKETSGRSLFRYKSSYKWDDEEVETNKKEMQEQIIYLMEIESKHSMSQQMNDDNVDEI